MVLLFLYFSNSRLHIASLFCVLAKKGGREQLIYMYIFFYAMLPNSTEDWLKASTKGETVFLNQNNLLSRTKALHVTKENVCESTYSRKFIPR